MTKEVEGMKLSISTGTDITSCMLIHGIQETT